MWPYWSILSLLSGSSPSCQSPLIVGDLLRCVQGGLAQNYPQRDWHPRTRQHRPAGNKRFALLDMMGLSASNRHLVMSRQWIKPCDLACAGRMCPINAHYKASQPDGRVSSSLALLSTIAVVIKVQRKIATARTGVYFKSKKNTIYPGNIPQFVSYYTVWNGVFLGWLLHVN